MAGSDTTGQAIAARRVILMRHGQTDYNAQMRFQGQIDIPLNAVGREEAAAAARYLVRSESLRAEMAEGAVKIVASPLIRAADTAAALAGELGLAEDAITYDEDLKERAYGNWEGLTAVQIDDFCPGGIALWQRGGVPEGMGIETREAVGERFARAVRRAGQQTPAGGTLVVVAHGGAIAAGVCELIGVGAQFDGITGMGNCCWSILVPSKVNKEHLRLLAYNRSWAGDGRMLDKHPV